MDIPSRYDETSTTTGRAVSQAMSHNTLDTNTNTRPAPYRGMLSKRAFSLYQSIQKRRESDTTCSPDSNVVRPRKKRVTTTSKLSVDVIDLTDE
jgi:hypothetical protein